MIKKVVKKQTAKKPKTVTTKSEKSTAGKIPKGIKKQYLKSKPVCKVTFCLPKEAATDAQKVTIVGDFNNWDKESTPMKKMKNGDFTVCLDLETNRSYSFRYLVNGKKWENDWCADRYEPNPFEGDNSVVVV